jgi:hypothetical protein
MEWEFYAVPLGQFQVGSAKCQAGQTGGPEIATSPSVRSAAARRASQWHVADWRLRIERRRPWVGAGGQMRKTNPISPGRRRLAEEIVQNEAKLGMAGVCGQRQLSRQAWLGGTVKRAKRTQFAPAAGVRRRPNVQNEPNSRRRMGRGQRGGGRGANAQNEPNSRRRMGRGQRAGGHGANAQNEANLPGGAGWPSRAPRPSGLGPPPTAIVQNEPNFARPEAAGRGNCAKRSQTWAGWGVWEKAVVT